MSEPSINDFLTEDHDRLDSLLESFEECRETDFAKAKDFLAQFTAGLHRHLGWEEGLLFPLFEEKTGKTGLTRTLRGEHDEIREWLKLLTEKGEQNDHAREYEAKMLIEELGGHNAREEYALYPELDTLLSDKEIGETLEAMMGKQLEPR